MAAREVGREKASALSTVLARIGGDGSFDTSAVLSSIALSSGTAAAKAQLGDGDCGPLSYGAGACATQSACLGMFVRQSGLRLVRSLEVSYQAIDQCRRVRRWSEATDCKSVPTRRSSVY